VQPISFGIRVGEFCVDLGLAEGLPCHLEVANEFIMLAGMIANLDDLSKVAGVLSLDIRL